MYMTECCFDKRWKVDEDGFLVDIETGIHCSGKIYNRDRQEFQQVSELRLHLNAGEKFQIEIPDGRIWTCKNGSASLFGEVALKRFGEGDGEEKKLYDSLKSCALSGDMQSAVELLKNLAGTFFISDEINNADFSKMTSGALYSVLVDFCPTGLDRFQFAQAGAFKNNASCQNKLAYCYEAGDGVEQNEKLALRWYKKSALNGNVSAMSRISQFYSWNNKACVTDKRKSFYWLKRAAEHGSVVDYKKLADWYASGTGTSRNERKTAYWLARSMSAD